MTYSRYIEIPQSISLLLRNYWEMYIKSSFILSTLLYHPIVYITSILYLENPKNPIHKAFPYSSPSPLKPLEH
jgi:hypothetical protein